MVAAFKLDCLAGLKPFAILDMPDPCQFTRDQFGYTYGGNGIQMIHKAQSTLLVVWEANPFLPTSPGEPGAIFCNIPRVMARKTWKLVARCPGNLSPPLWKYYDEYEVRRELKLPGEIFGRLETKVSANVFIPRVYAQLEIGAEVLGR